MLHEQLSFIPTEEIKNTKVCIKEEDLTIGTYKVSAVDAMVAVYTIYDPVTRKIYVGISKTPDKRLVEHQRGSQTGDEFYNVCQTRWDILVTKVYTKFRDENYSPASTNCLARVVESFAINYFDSIENGFNTTLDHHHDFNDTEFWEDILPEDLLALYRYCDHDILNERSLRNIRSQNAYHPTNTRIRNKDFKDWAIDYLIELQRKDVKVQKMAYRLLNIRRENLYKFINKRSYAHLSAAKTYQLIRAIETELNIIPSEYPYFDEEETEENKERWSEA